MPQKTRPFLLALILLSGFSALIYEITWTRHLSLLFGSNMVAAGTVAAMFMAGLAIGSLFFGRRADRSPNPLRLYAALEAGIAFTALLFPLALKLIALAFIPLAQHFPDNPAMIAFWRMVLAALALLPPTIFMGGTIPVVCRFLAARNLGGMVGRVYALNTLGAVTGCLVSGFLLVPHLGMIATQAVAILVNAGIAVAAMRWSRQTKTAPLPKAPDAGLPPKPAFRVLLLAGAALLGASALAYEMLWTRLFLLFLGNTTYAFATLLGVFLLGLTGGSALYARHLSKRPNQALTYLSLLSGMLLFILATLPAYDRLGFLFETIHRHAGDRWWFLSLASFFAVALPVLIPATLSGALFPATVTLLQPDPAHAGTAVGRVLFWNTLGSMFGSFFGVWTISLLGLQNSFKGVTLIALLYAASFLWAFRKTLPWKLAALPVALAFLLCLLPANWNQGLLNSGIYIYSHYYLNSGGLGNPGTTAQPEEVVEGIETTAAFFRSPDGYKEFRVNGKSDGGTRPGDMKTQILLGQLPMLLHPQARSALVIGLGTGITLAQVLDYPVSHVDCVEISPEVASLSRHFNAENGNVLASPRVDLLIRDGRNHLLTHEKRYDVIISEPSNPWQTGNANLFTREFYQLASSRLQPDGLFCQWLPLYDLPTGQLKIALQTFAASFAHVRVFLLGGDMILLGSTSPLSLEIALPEETHREAILGHLAQAGLASSQQLFEQTYFANRRLLEEAAGRAPLNTDNLPLLEFTHQTGLDLSRLNLRYLVELRRQLGSKAWE